MINNQNSHHYLKCLVKIAEDRPLKYDEIPKEFIDFFSLPGLLQCINILIDNIPEIDMDKVEDFFKNKNFDEFDDVATAIRNNFQIDFEKLYASYYYITQNIKYDEERSKMKQRNYLDIETIFKTKKGVCYDYAKFFNELTKRVGITSDKIKILHFGNASKGIDWNFQNPPSKPDFLHDVNYIEFNNQSFLSDPTWGSGDSIDKCRSYFFMPYYKGILNYFPEEDLLNETSKFHFTWNQFTSLNMPNMPKDLCFESNPFQRITVEDGFYDLQFSLIQPIDYIEGEIYYFKENEWCEKDQKYISFNCFGKNLPRHNFSFSNHLRCRYNMTISFPEIGEYKVNVYANRLCIFTVYFDVKNSTDKLIGICGFNKEKFGFTPIVPVKGLTKITHGYARIRFTVKLSRSPILLKLYSIIKGTMDREKEIQVSDWYNYYTTNLPFNYENKEEDLNDYLVEDWVLVKFPNDGLWEVEIYFDNGDTFIQGVKYYFDVTGTKKDNNINQFFDLPNNRTFVSSNIQMQKDIFFDPPTQTVFKEDSNFYFHVFSKAKIFAVFEKVETKTIIISECISIKDTDKKDVKDYEFSAPFLEIGHYKLTIFSKECFSIASQNYFITGKLPEESHEEKKMMKELKNSIEGKTNFLKDVPSSIQKTVQKMVEKAINDYNSNNDKDTKIAQEKINFPIISDESSDDEKLNLKAKINDLEKLTSNLNTQITELNKKISILKKQKEEQEKHSHSLEQEKNELSSKLNELLKQKQNLRKEINEMMIKSREFEQITNDLNSKVNELEKKKEEQNKYLRSLEQEHNEISSKLNDLMNHNQNEDKEKNEKAIQLREFEQKVNELSNKIDELEKQKEGQDKYLRSLEQEKNEISKKHSKLLEKKKILIKKNRKLMTKLSEFEQKINDLNSKVNELEKQKEEQNKYICSLEQEKNEMNSKLNELMDHSQNEDKEKNEKTIQLREVQNSQLEKIHKLNQEKNSMSKQIEELRIQLKERDDYAHSLELQILLNQENKNVQKINDFQRQKEEFKKISDNQKDDNNIKQKEFITQDEYSKEETKEDLIKNENVFKVKEPEKSINNNNPIDENENEEVNDNEKLLKIHQPDHQNTSPRRNKSNPNDLYPPIINRANTSPQISHGSVKNQKKICKIQKNKEKSLVNKILSTTPVKQIKTKNDDVSSNKDNFNIINFLDDSNNFSSSFSCLPKLKKY